MGAVHVNYRKLCKPFPTAYRTLIFSSMVYFIKQKNKNLDINQQWEDYIATNTNSIIEY